jgi:hypothetical protein
MTPAAQSRAFVITDVRGAYIPLETDALFPIEADVDIYDDVLPESVITLGFRILDGRPALVNFSVRPLVNWSEGPEITPTSIRSLPVEELASEAVRYVAMSVAAGAPAAFRRDAKKEGDRAVQARRRRRVMSDDLLADVARVATENPTAPTKAVADQLHCSYRTAGRWVALARERGLLPQRGKEGRTP